jgi:hypothetical protein
MAAKKLAVERFGKRPAQILAANKYRGNLLSGDHWCQRASHRFYFGQFRHIVAFLIIM